MAEEQITVQNRISDIEEFLNGNNAQPPSVNVIQTNATQLAPAITSVSSPFLDELKKMNYYQNLARIRWEKDNAVAGDINVHDWNEAEVPPGFLVTFTFQIPEGWVLHISECSIVFATDTTYKFIRDGIYEPTMSEFFMDYADHYKIFSPPLRAYKDCIITATNVSDETNVYSVFFSGFLRRYRRTTEIMSEETTLIEKSTKSKGMVI